MPAAHCPWSSFTPQTHYFCEEALCGFVRYPADTWTLIAFVISGAMIIRASRRSGPRELWVLGALTILVGVASAPVHVTGSYWGQLVDLWSMFLIASYLVADSVRRLRGWTFLSSMLLGSALAAAQTVHMAATQGSGIFVFAASIGAALGLELIYLKRNPQVDRRILVRTLALFAAGFGVWCLDYFRILCSPANHFFTGHGVWHFCNAATLYGLYMYLRQLPRRDRIEVFSTTCVDGYRSGGPADGRSAR